MKQKQDKLHQLIHRLTKTEKGYVNKALKMNQPHSNLFQLYHILSRMNGYDEVQLKKKLGSGQLSRNLAVTKKHLFDRILEIIRNYHSEKNGYRKALNLIQDIDFLFEKGMLETCQKRIEKGLLITEEYELPELHIHFLEWRKRIFNHTYYQANVEMELEENWKKSKEKITQLEKSISIEHQQVILHQNIFHKKWSTKDNHLQDDIFSLEEYIETHHSKPSILPTQKRERIALADIQARIQFFKGNKSETDHIINGIEFDADTQFHPLTIENWQRILLVKLALNIIVPNQWNELYAQITSLHLKYPFLKSINHTELMVRTYTMQHQYMNGLDFEQDTVEAAEEYLEQHDFQLPMGSWCAFHISRYYFNYGYYKEAHIWNIRALNQTQQNIKNFSYVCKFNMMMILLELQHYNMLKKSIQELRRFLVKRDKLSALDQALITFFRDAENKWNKNNHTHISHQFSILTQPYEKELNATLFYLEIPKWLKANEKGMSLHIYKNIES